MLNQWFKLAILAFVGIIVGSLAIGVVSGFDQQTNPAAGIFSIGDYNGNQNAGAGYGPGPGMRNYSQGQMPGMNIQENVNVRVQMPNGMNVQMNKSEGMNNMKGMGMMNMGN